MITKTRGRRAERDTTELEYVGVTITDTAVLTGELMSLIFSDRFGLYFHPFKGVPSVVSTLCPDSFSDLARDRHNFLVLASTV